MKDTTSEIQFLFSQRKTKDELVKHIKENPYLIEPLIKYSIFNTEPNNWRAAWLICHVMKKNDTRIVPYIDTIIEIIPNKTDGHQRQLLIILEKMDWDESQEGIIFNLCLTLWENIHKIPSTRITAFSLLLKIAEKHPDLIAELELWTSDYFTETLSPGIKNSLLNKKRKLAKHVAIKN